jgi:hypothetical protein
VLLRAAAADIQRTVRNAVTDATESGLTYVIVRGDGTREILYSISLFAQRDGRSVAETLRTFSWAPRYLRFTVKEIRAAGFDIVATGANPDTTTCSCFLAEPRPMPHPHRRNCRARLRCCCPARASYARTPPTIKAEYTEHA